MENPTESNSLLTKYPKFSCTPCYFKSCNKKDYKRHLQTAKHLELLGTCGLEKTPIDIHGLKTDEKNFKIPGQSGVLSEIIATFPTKKTLSTTCNNNTQCVEKRTVQPAKTYLSQDIHKCACNKQYKTASGLWKHKKICDFVICDKDEAKTTNATITKWDENMLSAFMTIIKQNQDFKDFMVEQAQEQQKYNQCVQNHNQELQTQLLELVKEGRNTVINNTSFNLHVYLNETCKNAMNMLDYVNSLQLDLTDLEETGKLGYTNGMSRIFINGLKDMDVHMRPIHCSDLKREVLYIKDDNVWEKDNENRDKLKSALRKIEKKNIMLIPLWIKAHPNCVISSNRENTPYLKMVMNSTGGENPAETADMAKIITNIAKAVVINK